MGKMAYCWKPARGVPAVELTYRNIFYIILRMTTKQRFRNKYRLQLRERDHLPPHVHLVGGGVNVRINLETLESAGACPRDVLKEVLAWVADHQIELLQEWKQWHP